MAPRVAAGRRPENAGPQIRILENQTFARVWKRNGVRFAWTAYGKRHRADGDKMQHVVLVYPWYDGVVLGIYP